MQRENWEFETHRCVPRRRDRAPWAGCGRGGERVSPARGCASCSKRLARHVVIALVRAEDYSISEAVNRLLRGSLPAEEGQPKQAIRRTEWHNGYWPFRRDTFQRMAAVSRTCRLPSRRPSRFFSRRFSSTISATSCFRRPFSFRRSVTSWAVASEPVADQPSGPCSAVLPDSKYCDQESGSEKTAKQHIEDMGVGAKGHAARPANRSLVFFRLAVISREQPLDQWFFVAVIDSIAGFERPESGFCGLDQLSISESVSET